MANEIRVQVSVTVNKGSQRFQNPVTAFVMNMLGIEGPTPGYVLVSTGGNDVDLSLLSTPGICLITNLDSTNYIEYGIYDPETTTFFPLGEIGPGEFYPIKLSRNFGEQYAGTGTGTTAATNRLRLKANTAEVPCKVEAFER